MTEFVPQNNPDSPIQFKGKAPPQFLKALQEAKETQVQNLQEQKMKNPMADVLQEQEEQPQQVPAAAPKPASKMPVQKPKQSRATGEAKITHNTKLAELLKQLAPSYVYDEITLPSRGVFYTGKDGPTDGVLHIRPMSGEEEQILATPRHVRRGVAINMIFQRCVKETIRADELLSVDRTYLLIWLRGISYGNKYEVKITCPECARDFNHQIDLATLMINYCPEDFGPPLEEVMPKSGFNFRWKLPRGNDETLVQAYKDRMLKEFGDSHTDDSMIYRISLMLEEVEGLTNKTELMVLLKKLPVQDISYLRTLAIEPPFGVDTKCQVGCPNCYHDFEVELPLEAGFFFPRHHKEETNSDSGDT